jgi:hypothetical protein
MGGTGPTRAWAAAASVVALCAACSRTTPDAGGQPSPDAGDDAVRQDASRPATGENRSVAIPPPTMTLLESGAAPRRPLRYAWRLDQRERLTMDLRTTAATSAPDGTTPRIPLPPVRIVIDVDPQAVTPDGDLRYAWHVVATDVGVDAGAPGPVVDGMRAEVAAVAALSGSGVVTSRGLARDVAIDPSSLADTGATGQMVEQVLQTLRDVAAPFPAEDVGVGARWQKLSEVVSSDARVTQTETFTLVDAADGRGALHNVLAQTAPSQALRAAGMPDGAQARMESMLVSADAKTRFDVTRLVPQTRLESTTTMVLSGHSPGDSTRRVGMVLRAEIVISGSTR